IDDDANGRGWFVDATPSRDEEFVNGTARTRAARNGVDLLTVITHELGHVLGGVDVDGTRFAGNIMADKLGVGERRQASTFGQTTTSTSTASTTASVSTHDLVKPTEVVAASIAPLAKKARAVNLDDNFFGPFVG
ncbi:MAG: hypothetical protein ACRCZF_01035, partial [Gemmataceae bacterium]